MCELLGMSFNLPVRASISFRGFCLRGDKNPHGWGLAYYPDNSAQVFKEPIKMGDSALSKFVENYKQVKSMIFIGHVRLASVGNHSHKNTHPFFRELSGRDYIFAHNGTLRDYQKNLTLGRFQPVGETDSEYAFCYLLNCIENRRITSWGEDDFKWLARKIAEVNDYGSFNCILSDGLFLFCYHDRDCYNGLCFVHRIAPYDRIQLKDEEFCINLADEKDPKQTGFVVATRELTNETWENFNPGELIIFSNGKMNYSNCRNVP